MRVDFPHPDGAEITMKSGFVFMRHSIPKISASSAEAEKQHASRNFVRTVISFHRPAPDFGRSIAAFGFLVVARLADTWRNFNMSPKGKV